MTHARGVIRPYRLEDEAAVVRVWHRSGLAAYTFLPTWQSFTLEEAELVFRDVIASRCEIWVGAFDDEIVGYLALSGSYVDRLYVDPERQGIGWGTRFVEHAKRLHPGGLELHTHQENFPARSLYEAQGFVPVAFGISPPPECARDMEYHWRPRVA